MRIAHEIVEGHESLQDVYLVAVPNGGVPLGRILVQNLEELTGVRVPLGLLDTTLYRDDVLVTSERPPLRVTEMPSSVDERVVLLVEDVVSTGRTIRAAMDGLMDFGRPRAVRVVALIDRGHRELPIKIDFVGKNVPTRPGESVTLRLPGGGGFFPPWERDPMAVLEDVRQERVSAEAAREEYGVAIDVGAWRVEEGETERLRKRMREDEV